MNRKRIFFYMSLLAALFITACSDTDNPDGDENPSTEGKALLILSEGGFGQNNSTLSRYDLLEKKLVKDHFQLVNKRGLGDTGNDMLLYGSKMYIVVNVSSTIEVVEAATGKSIGQIQMKAEDGSGKQPRQIVSYNGKVYVTSFDDTVTRIDTASLKIDASVKVGMDPDGIVIKNNKIYVANSGGLNYLNGYDNTVSVINLNNFTEEKKIEVGVNPANLKSDSQGDIYVSVMGNYGDIPPAFKRIDRVTGDVETIAGVVSPGRFVISDNKAYIISGAYGTPYKVLVYDCLNEKLISQNFVQDNTEIGIIHNIAVDDLSGDLFIMESDYTTPGTVYCFNKDGKLEYSIPAIGLNPTAIVVLR